MNTVVAHPQSNDLVERANKSLMHGLKARLRRERVGWVDELPNILWAHRTMLKTNWSTGSPLKSTSSRPDFVQAVCYCARYQARPTQKHLKEVKRIFKYLKGTINMGLWYPKDSGFELTAFSDADHAGCLDTQKSTSGGIQLDVKETKLHCNVFSRGRVCGVICKLCSSNVDEDTTSRLWLQLQQNTVVLRLSVENGIIELYFVRTEYQLADMFTKALPEDRFKYLVRRIGMRCLTPAELEVVRLGINPMIQPEPEDLPKDNPKLEITVLSVIRDPTQTIVANSTTEAEYVAAANCCGHVLWIQNQMLNYGFNFMNTKIYIDNESTIYVVKNLVFHSKTKHIEIRYHFIRDSYEKKLIQFVDQHNMVACLERTEENAKFHQIVDFLTTSSIHYALTISLTEPLNDTYETPKHTKKVFTNMKRKRKGFSRRITPLFALMLAPPVVRGEGSGQPSKPQPPSSTTQPIIEEQILVTKLSSPQNTQSPRQALQKDTQLPQTSVPIPNVADEAIFKERDDRVVRATTTATSLDAAQASGNIPKTQSTAMSKRASKHSYDSPLPRVNTPASDEERNEQQDLTDFIPPTPYDSPPSGGHTPRSDEGRPHINELMAICKNLSNRVLALEQSKTAQDLVIIKLQKKVKRLEKALRARTPGIKLFNIGTSRRKGLDKENVSKQGRKSNKTKPMFKDSNFDVLDDTMENVEGGSTAKQITTAGDTLSTASINMTTIADTLVAIRSTRPRTTLIVIRNDKEEPRRVTPVPTVQSQDKGKGKMVEPKPTPKNPRKAQIQMDEELAQRLFEEEQAQFEREQRIAREKAA
ncbi:putative ribonuclease H-like domain-containing protein [Tanacetum coccineum]